MLPGSLRALGGAERPAVLHEHAGLCVLVGGLDRIGASVMGREVLVSDGRACATELPRCLVWE